MWGDAESCEYEVAEGDVLALDDESLIVGGGASLEKQHVSLRAVQFEHRGRTSSHLTRRLRH